MSDDKTRWTLELIERLLEAKIGEPLRLDAINLALKNQRQVYEVDKQYLKERFRELREKEGGQTFGDKSQDKSTDTSEDDYSIMILKNRLAKGEISPAEFDDLRAKITRSDSNKKDDLDSALSELVARIQRLERRTDSLEAEIKLDSEQDGIETSIKLKPKK